MNATLPVNDLNTLMAEIFISMKKSPSTMSLVLSELMKHSEGGVITHPIPVGAQIAIDLGITPENYRKCISKLVALDLLTRDHSMLLLSPVINKIPLCDAVTLRRRK